MNAWWLTAVLLVVVPMAQAQATSEPNSDADLLAEQEALGWLFAAAQAQPAAQPEDPLADTAEDQASAEQPPAETPEEQPSDEEPPRRPGESAHRRPAI